MRLPLPIVYSSLTLRRHQPITRRILTRPRLSSFILLTFLLSLGYFILWRVHSSKWGRYYYNYFLSIHPALMYMIPKGNWGTIDNSPRWSEEIYKAPWMGEWELPTLTQPIYSHSLTNYSNESERKELINPVIAKLHIFSTSTSKSREKRRLIRELSPLLVIPEAYRHLFELKFVLGHNNDDAQEEKKIDDEQRLHGDLLRLDNLKNGENLREGKILRWIQKGADTQTEERERERETWWLFKIDDDTVPNLAVFLDTLLTLDPHDSYYLGTSLVRWPGYHHHFTGILTGFSWPLLKTLAAGIDQMPREEVEVWWDDDVLTGELMFDLPSAPHCRPTPPSTTPDHHSTELSLPVYCDPHAPPPWGYQSSPPSRDPRTGLIRYDFLRRMGDPGWIWLKGDVARHGWPLKPLSGYRKEWETRVRDRPTTWKPPKWLEKYADPALL